MLAGQTPALREVRSGAGVTTRRQARARGFRSRRVAPPWAIAREDRWTRSTSLTIAHARPIRTRKASASKTLLEFRQYANKPRWPVGLLFVVSNR
jgi:hypothetical protein